MAQKKKASEKDLKFLKILEDEANEILENDPGIVDEGNLSSLRSMIPDYDRKFGFKNSLAALHIIDDFLGISFFEGEISYSQMCQAAYVMSEGVEAFKDIIKIQEKLELTKQLQMDEYKEAALIEASEARQQFILKAHKFYEETFRDEETSEMIKELTRCIRSIFEEFARVEEAPKKKAITTKKPNWFYRIKECLNGLFK